MCRATSDLEGALAAVSGALQDRSARFRAAAPQGQSARPDGAGRGGRRDLRPCARPTARGGAAAPRGDGRGGAPAPRSPCRRRRRAARRRRRGRRGRARRRARSAASPASSPTRCAGPGPIIPSRPISIIRASPSASFTTARTSPGSPRSRRATDAIRADFERVMAAERAELVPYIQYPDDVPLRQWAELNRNRAWTAIHLVQNGVTIDGQCPPLPGGDGAARPSSTSRTFPGAAPMRCSRCSRRAPISRPIPASPTPAWSATCR